MFHFGLTRSLNIPKISFLCHHTGHSINTGRKMHRSLNSLPDSWKELLDSCLDDANYALCYLDGCARVVPKAEHIFRAFQMVEPQNVKVIIVGQDPYPDSEHATGLAFGVNRGIDCPRTLTNILNEVEACLNEPEWDMVAKKQIPKDTIMLNRSDVTLEGWAKQGVLLLNSVLTTEDRRIGAHTNIGWEAFTDNVLYSIRQLHTIGPFRPIVFMLWGQLAQAKYAQIAPRGALPNWLKVLKSTHPGPLSHNRGDLLMRFQGCRHFNAANTFLKRHGAEEIDWSKTGA